MAALDMIFINGWASDQGVWQVTRNYLGKRYRVHTLDLPPLVDSFTYRDAVVQLIRGQGLNKVILAGWSMGSLVVMQAAKEWPGAVKGLVLISGTSKFTSESSGGYNGGLSPVLVARMKKRLTQDLPKTLLDFYQLMFSPRERQLDLDRIIVEKYLRGRPWELAEVLGGLDYLLRTDLRPELKAIACPVLLIHGDRDEICPLKGALYLQANLSQASLKVFPECGHVPFLTQGDSFHLCLEEWVNSYGLE
ncbi:MAG: alpha/beta fold hydrolase [Bacillota bacterium]